MFIQTLALDTNYFQQLNGERWRSPFCVSYCKDKDSYSKRSKWEGREIQDTCKSYGN